MYESSTELAENKLIVLYVLKRIKHPLSNTQLTEIILENNFINYFTLQQYISELITSEFIKYEIINDKNLITLTEKGDSVLSFFTERITLIKKEIIDQYISSKLDTIKKELTIYSDYTLGKDDSFIVDLKALEGDSLLMELKLSVPSKKQAVSICNKWKDNPSSYYTHIINSFFNENN